VHLALKQRLTIVPVINKIDLPNADIPTVRKQLEEILAIRLMKPFSPAPRPVLGGA